jgi:hypothetical protein
MIDERTIQPNVSQAYHNLSDYWILSHGENGGIAVSDAANYLGLTEQAVRSICRTRSEFYAEDTQYGWRIDPKGLVVCKFIRCELKKKREYGRKYGAEWCGEYLAWLQDGWYGDDDKLFELIMSGKSVIETCIARLKAEGWRLEGRYMTCIR